MRIGTTLVMLEFVFILSSCTGGDLTRDQAAKMISAFKTPVRSAHLDEDQLIHAIAHDLIGDLSEELIKPWRIFEITAKGRKFLKGFGTDLGVDNRIRTLPGDKLPRRSFDSFSGQRS